jgi:hypothetical protein
MTEDHDVHAVFRSGRSPIGCKSAICGVPLSFEEDFELNEPPGVPR